MAKERTYPVYIDFVDSRNRILSKILDLYGGHLRHFGFLGALWLLTLLLLIIQSYTFLGGKSSKVIIKVCL